jgi:hypothetical protein
MFVDMAAAVFPLVPFKGGRSVEFLDVVDKYLQVVGPEVERELVLRIVQV